MSSIQERETSVQPCQTFLRRDTVPCPMETGAMSFSQRGRCSFCYCNIFVSMQATSKAISTALRYVKNSARAPQNDLTKKPKAGPFNTKTFHSFHLQFVGFPGHIIELVQHTVDHLWRLCWAMMSKLHSDRPVRKQHSIDSHALFRQLCMASWISGSF